MGFSNLGIRTWMTPLHHVFSKKNSTITEAWTMEVNFWSEAPDISQIQMAPNLEYWAKLCVSIMDRTTPGIRLWNLEDLKSWSKSKLAQSLGCLYWPIIKIGLRHEPGSRSGVWIEAFSFELVASQKKRVPVVFQSCTVIFSIQSPLCQVSSESLKQGGSESCPRGFLCYLAEQLPGDCTMGLVLQVQSSFPTTETEWAF